MDPAEICVVFESESDRNYVWETEIIFERIIKTMDKIRLSN